MKSKSCQRVKLVLIFPLIVSFIFAVVVLEKDTRYVSVWLKMNVLLLVAFALF